MLHLMLAFVLVGTGPRQAAAPQPVFRTDVYAVPFEFSIDRRFFFGMVRKPVSGLTKDDITVILDNRSFTPREVIEDKKKRGTYLVSFTPPEEYRDGETHTIDLQFTLKGRGGREQDIRFPGGTRTVIFPKPAQ